MISRSVALLLPATFIAGALFATRPASACSYAGAETFTPDPDEGPLDDVPPTLIRVTDVDLHRYLGDGSSSCDGISLFTIKVKASDNRSAPDQIGFEIRLIEGSIGIDVPLEPVTGHLDGAGNVDLVFGWLTDEPTSGVIEITVIDRAGNRGNWVQIEVEDPGLAGGCQVGGGGGWSGALMALAALGLLGLRRRRQPPRAA